MWFQNFWRPPFYLRSVLINLKSGEALTGVLFRVRGPWHVLENASALKVGAQPTPIDGSVMVHRDNIAFVQVLR